MQCCRCAYTLYLENIEVLLYISVFLDDSLGDRVWVDNSECQSFVKNIVTAFRTKLDESITINDGKEVVDLTEKPIPRYVDHSLIQDITY